MNALGYLLLLLVITVRVAWFVSEFHERRWLRLTLGIASILLCFGVAFLAGTLQRLNYNAWYGVATKEFIDVTISELEAGNKDRVLLSLKNLQHKYSPTYENRANYDEWVKEVVTDIKGRN